VNTRGEGPENRGVKKSNGKLLQLPIEQNPGNDGSTSARGVCDDGRLGNDGTTSAEQATSPGLNVNYRR